MKSWLLVFSIILSLCLGACAIAPLTSPLDAARWLDHDYGRTAVPVTPSRIVALGNGAIEAVLSVGLRPVGAAPWIAAGYGGDWPSFLSAEQWAGITYLGNVNQPSLERIAMLRPDLILGDSREHGALYPLLSQIAPTVLWDVLGDRWQVAFTHYAAALGQADRAAAVLAAYDRRVQALRDGWPKPAPTVSVLRFMPNQIRLYLGGSPIGRILQEVGLRRPPHQDRPVWKERLTVETLDRADADWLLITQSDPRSRHVDRIRHHPLWQHLRAVQAGQVYPVDFTAWIGGEGAIAANRVLDDLEPLQ